MPLKNTEKEKPVESDTALRELYRKTFGAAPETCEPLKADGSARCLFRLKAGSRSVIGAFGPDKLENRAFLEFSRHFRAQKLPVPEIYAAEPAQGVYLEEDLGSTTLFEYLCAERHEVDLPEPVLAAYKKVLEILPRFQAQVREAAGEAQAQGLNRRQEQLAGLLDGLFTEANWIVRIGQFFNGQPPGKQNRIRLSLLGLLVDAIEARKAGAEWAEDDLPPEADDGD